ncbi:hypothetical protein ILUMI_26637 [Ignelater luminosus]|uniref:Transposase n=1 Tax=Ignelater luminosus TaxID=2038154 RepID=A0A8K0C9F6_IGNLU|nr:hypothetical protein ILUMI_26637 [Ignelater luminosus]
MQILVANNVFDINARNFQMALFIGVIFIKGLMMSKNRKSKKGHFEIAKNLRISKSVVHQVVKKIRERDSSFYTHGRRQIRKITLRQDRLPIRNALQEQFLSATTLKDRFLRATGVAVSTQTVENQSARCLFTDESEFVLFYQDGRLRVWRRMGERYSENCMTSRTPFGGGSIMIWRAICLRDHTELITYKMCR